MTDHASAPPPPDPDPDPGVHSRISDRAENARKEKHRRAAALDQSLAQVDLDVARFQADLPCAAQLRYWIGLARRQLELAVKPSGPEPQGGELQRCWVGRRHVWKNQQR